MFSAKDIRLVGDPNDETRGRVELLHMNEWGTICDKDFDDIDAAVACRHLGYHGGIMIETFHYGKFITI